VGVNLPLVTPETLAEKMAGAPRLLLMLDYDGTLVPIAPTPDQARPEQELISVLGELSLLPGRVVAIISGRRLSELQELIPLAGLHLVGAHGAEIQEADGKVHRLFKDQRAKEIISELDGIARECIASRRGFLVENKGISLALHYRQADPFLARQVIDNFIKKISSLPDANRLELMPGKKVLEVRPRGVNKGLAVRYLCRKHAGALPVYIGDDITDEDAFKALKNGCTILVSPRPRPSAASARLPSPRHVGIMLSLLLAKTKLKVR